MDFTLKIFYTVATLKSFSKASESLFLTQPTISFHIKKIENEFEVQLFERKNNKIYLTQAGQILFDYAEQVFSEYERIKIKINEISTDYSGTLKVGVASLISQYLFPNILSTFKKTCPNINVIMLIGDSQELIIKLQQKEIDLAIVSEPVSLKNFNILHFFDDKIVPIINTNHEWADKNCILIDDLFRYPLVSREEGSGSRKIFEKFLRRNYLNPNLLNVSFSLGSAEAVKSAVINGMGYGVVSKLAIQEELEKNILRIANVKEMDIVRNFLILFSPDKQENKRFKIFLDFIVSYTSNFNNNFY